MQDLVILKADDGFHFLETRNFAESSIEAIDIEAGMYTAYDGNGMKLHLSGTPNNAGVISVPLEAEDCKALLIPELRDYFCRVGIPESAVSSLGFDELVAIGVERFLERRPESFESRLLRLRRRLFSRDSDGFCLMV